VSEVKAERTRENNREGTGRGDSPSYFIIFRIRALALIQENNIETILGRRVIMTKVNAYVGQDWVVLVCQGQEQRLFHHANTLFYSTRENKECLVRLAESGAKDGDGLAKLVQSSEDLVWMVEGMQNTLQLRTLGCMQMAAFFENPEAAHARYDQG